METLEDGLNSFYIMRGTRAFGELGDRILWFKMCLDVWFTRERFVMINLHCQLDWTEKSLVD
jgi:hypothetical protein